MTEEQLLHLAGLGLLMVCSAFFSGSETALFAIDRLRLSHLVEKQRPGAARLEGLLTNSDRLLGTLLVGNNIVNIAVSVFTTTFFVALYGERGELLTILILTPMLLIFAEVFPKSYAAKHAERVSFWVLRPVLLVMTLLTPIVWLVSGVSRLLQSLTGKQEERPRISGEEIRTIISVGEQAGTVPKEQHRMLHSVFELAEMRVSDVMIPRTEVVGLPAQATFEEALTLAQESMHSRFPVFEESLDNIVGVLHAKDILARVGVAEPFDLSQLARHPFFVPETQSIEKLLQSLRTARVHLAIVVDEYGGVAGIVTLEDIVEQIVGEIHDEYDEEETPFRELEPNRYLVDGSVALRDVNRRFGLTLTEEHVTTLAGFVLRTIGSIPEVGASCTADGAHFVVRKMVENRIEELEMTISERLSGPAEEA